MSRKITRYIHAKPGSDNFDKAVKVGAELNITFYRLVTPEKQSEGVFAELEAHQVRNFRNKGIYVRHPTVAEHRRIAEYGLQEINTVSPE